MPVAINHLAAEVADESGLRECLQWFTREKKWITDHQLEICRIAAPTFQERPRAEWMADQFRQAGWTARLDRAGNVIAALPAAAEPPRMAVTAHLDTVLAPRHPDDIRVAGDGRLYGPGVADNGAGLAALLALARAISACDAARFSSLLLVANVGEEGEGNLSGMRYLCRPAGAAAKLKAILVLDGPGTDHITSRALASRRFEVIISGPGGHSWSDFGAGNPVHAISRAIALFSDHLAVSNGARHASAFNFGTLEGGPSVNSIPAQARTKLDLRSESMERIDQLTELLNGCVERALEVENDRASGGKVTGKIREIGFRPAGQLADGARILACLRKVDSQLGLRAQTDCASTDANIPLSMGVEAVSIGAGGSGGGAHSPSEWYNPEGREIGLKRILLTLALLLRDGA